MTHDELIKRIDDSFYDAKNFGASDWCTKPKAPKWNDPKRTEIMAERRVWSRKYYEADGKAMDAFKNDMEEIFKVKGNPKAEKLWKLAWDFGHGSGLREVLNYYSDFVELIN